MMQHRPLFTFVMLFVVCAAAMPGIAQEDDPMIVQRIKAVDQTKPIFNIYVDEDNNKWIGNSEAIFFVEAKDRAERREIPAGQQSLMQLPGGDSDIRWDKSEIKRILGDAVITTAAYNKRDDMLWIGTDGYGVYKIKVNAGGSLRLIEEIFIDNSKLRSDFINRIYITSDGKIWIATEDGAMLIENGSSSIHQKFFNIQTISGDRRDTWATGDGIVWIIDKRNNWKPIEIDKFEIEGETHDIALDQDGKIWIASNIMTSYKIDADYYQHFGPGQYFTSQFVNYVSVDEDGTIWVGSDDKGVYIIEKASTITVTPNLDQALSCDGSVDDAAMTVSAIGGSPPYEFRWSDGQTGERRQNLGAGVYSITVTDTQGSSKVEDVEIPNPVVNLELTLDQQESGEGASDGSVSLLTVGGVPGYNARWSNGSTATQLSGLSAGVYSVTVTDQAGCTATGEIEVTRQVGELMVQIEQVSAVRCAGSAEANISAVVTGGSQPCTYAWTNIDGTVNTVEGLIAGDYSVTVTDADGTTASASITVEDAAEFTAEAVVVQSATTNNSDGQASVNLLGGQEPFTYAWSSGASEAAAASLGPAEHTVTVTDANGCMATSSITITEDILPLAVSIEQQQDILCAGESSGGLLADITGGKGPYTYLWSTGSSNENLEDISSGTYTITVTDAKGSTASFETALTEPEPLLVNTSIDGVASTSNSDGAASVSAAGGVGDYAYTWSHGRSEASLTDLAAGEYTVIVTDANGCTADATITMSENILPLGVTIEQTDDILCAGDASGALIADVAGGKAPFTYEWSNGSLGAESEAMTAGFYTVTVTDVTGSTAVFETELTEPEKLVVNALVEQSASTDQSDGSARVSVSGGTEDYTYSWSNGSTEVLAENLPAGDYGVTVTDINGCVGTASVSITENILPLSVSVDGVISVDCNGANTGALNAVITGGKGPFSYQWSNDDGSLQASDTESSLQDLGAGVYTLTVTDAIDNEATFQVEITEPSPLLANVVIESPASTDLSDGKATATGSGGAPSYSYAWDNGETAAQASALAAGQHTVTVTDEAGCTTTATFEVTEDILPLQATITQAEELKCNGDATAMLTAESTGGKGPFEYTWSSGLTGPVVTDLGAGTYVVTISDALGSEGIKSFVILEPAALVANPSIESVASTDQSDGVARANALGGTEPYSFAWSTGENGATASNLAMGEYTLTVTDANGCTALATLVMTEDILPLTLDVERDVSQIICQGDATGIVTTLPQGGKKPFTYAWSDGGNATAERADLGDGTYTITVTDALGSTATATVPIQEPELLVVNANVLSPATTGNADGSAEVVASGGVSPYSFTWEDGVTTEINSALSPGPHTVVVTDDNGCSATTQVEIGENILPLNVTLNSSEDILCSGANTALAEVSLSGGKGPFTYSWSDGETAETRASLSAGQYSVTVTDAEGTTASASLDITEPEILILNAVAVSSASTDGQDGSAKAEASGGTPPYTFNWENGVNLPEVDGLAAGQYTVTVTDNSGCTSTATIDITENILPLVVTLEQTEIIQCGGASTGSATATVEGGKAPFNYAWSDGTNSGDNLANLGAGDYSVTVTDALGTEAISTVSIAEPLVMTATVTNVSPASTDGADGAAEVQVTGGTAPYSYDWGNALTGQSLTTLTSGNYTITITDANGCTTTSAVEITENILPLAVTASVSQEISCAGISDGALAAATTGGKGPFSFSWSAGGSEKEVSGMQSGSYTVTVTDATGQTAEATVDINAPDAMQLEITDIRAAAAEHVPDGRGNAVVTGGAGGYTFKWDSGETAQRAEELGIGSHSVTVTDANGCTVSASVEISKKIIPALTAENLASGQAVRMENLQFEADSSRITTVSEPTLDELYDFLYDNPTIVVEIGGHTNGLPEHDYCDSLSTVRAKSVATWIVNKGIDAKRVYYKGYGKRRPVATNRTPDGRRKNQRVEVRILKLEDTN